MVNNEENWLPRQIKEWFNKKIKNKSPKSDQSLGLVKFQVPSPQSVNADMGVDLMRYGKYNAPFCGVQSFMLMKTMYPITG